MSNFDKVLKKMRELDTDGNQALEIAVMEKYSKELGEHFDSCISYIHSLNLPVEEAKGGVGYNFHKGLRQFDVTNSGKVDMLIWNYLGTRDCVFWDAYLEVKI